MKKKNRRANAEGEADDLAAVADEVLQRYGGR